MWLCLLCEEGRGGADEGGGGGGGVLVYGVVVN